MMEENMAWAVFHREFNWNRPGSPYAFQAFARAAPQQKPQDFIDAAVKAGAAERFDSPDRTAKDALKAKQKQEK